LIDSAASFGVASGKERRVGDTCGLLLFSANHADSLRRQVQSHLAYAEQHPSSISDLSYALGARRYFLPHRAFCVVSGQAPPQVSSFAKAMETPKVIGVFTGQGAQYAQMGRQLIVEEYGFRETIRSLDAILGKLADAPSWTIEGRFNLKAT